MKNYYYVQNDFAEDIYDLGIRFSSLKKAVEYAVEQKSTANLIHNGWHNFDRYQYGDTVETLLARCKAYEDEIRNR